LIKIIIKEENFKWHLEAFASELIKKKYINMREIIVVSMMMGRIGIKLTHLPKLLYLTEANLGGFVPSPMSLLFLLRP